MTYESKQVSISINRSVKDVYDFASDPMNMSKWAKGLSQSVLKKSGNEWIAESSMGTVKIKFTEKNTFGVLDHDVTLPSGEVNHNPLRVVKNDKGSEVIFTLYRINHTKEEFEKDAEMVKADLESLKSILEM